MDVLKKVSHQHFVFSIPKILYKQLSKVCVNRMNQN